MLITWRNSVVTVWRQTKRKPTLSYSPGADDFLSSVSLVLSVSTDAWLVSLIPSSSWTNQLFQFLRIESVRWSGCWVRKMHFVTKIEQICIVPPHRTSFTHKLKLYPNRPINKLLIHKKSLSVLCWKAGVLTVGSRRLKWIPWIRLIHSFQKQCFLSSFFENHFEVTSSPIPERRDFRSHYCPFYKKCRKHPSKSAKCSIVEHWRPYKCWRGRTTSTSNCFLQPKQTIVTAIMLITPTQRKQGKGLQAQLPEFVPNTNWKSQIKAEDTKNERMDH